MYLVKPHYRDQVHQTDAHLVAGGGNSGPVHGVVGARLVGHEVHGHEGQHPVVELSVRLIWCSSNIREVAETLLCWKDSIVLLDHPKSSIKRCRFLQYLVCEEAMGKIRIEKMKEILDVIFQVRRGHVSNIRSETIVDGVGIPDGG